MLKYDGAITAWLRGAYRKNDMPSSSTLLRKLARKKEIVRRRQVSSAKRRLAKTGSNRDVLRGFATMSASGRQSCRVTITRVIGVSKERKMYRG